MNSTEEQNGIVCLPRILADQIDNSLSPFDSLVVIGQIYEDLPEANARSRPGGQQPITAVKARTARVDWAGIGLSFVEEGGRLHVVDVWHFSPSDHPLPEVDCVLDQPTDMDRYVTVEGSDESDTDR